MINDVIEIVQGDSYGHDFTSPDVPTFDGDWSGKWAIVPSLGKAAVRQGVLGKSVDLKTLMLRIVPADTEVLAVGNYVLVAQVENSVIAFRREVMQSPLKIGRQGIPA